MKQQEDLFQLIHSLDKHEKRFFKLSVSTRKGEKEYVQLFDILAQQSEYNPEAICKELGIGKSVFAHKKNYLHRILLDRMIPLYSSTETQIRKLLTQAEFLYHKGLFKQQIKILGKAKEIATKNGLSSYTREILKLEQKYAWQHYDMEKIEANEAEMEKNDALINNEAAYQSITIKILKKVVVLGNARDREEIKSLKKILNHPIMKNEKNAISFAGEQAFYNAYETYYFFVGNTKKRYVYSKKRVESYWAHPEKQKDVFYIMAVNNLIESCYELKQYDEGKKYLEEITALSKHLKSARDRAWSFFCYGYTILSYHIKTGQFEEAVPLLAKIQQEQQKYGTKLNSIQSTLLNFKMAITYFGLKKYDASIDLMNKIRNTETFNFRQDIESATQAFYLIVHFEKRNAELIPYLVKSLYRYLSAKKIQYKFENILFEFFGKDVFEIKSGKELIEQFIQLRKKLLPLENDSYENTPFKEFDYISWLESKIENRSFAQIAKEKSRI